MHITQEKILSVFRENNWKVKINLRRLGRIIGVKNPQTVKHHLYQLHNWGIIHFSRETKIWYIVEYKELQKEYKRDETNEEIIQQKLSTIKYYITDFMKFIEKFPPSSPIPLQDLSEPDNSDLPSQPTHTS